MNRLKISRLAAVARPDDEEVVARDPRRQSAQVLNERGGEVLAAIEGAFVGTSLLRDRERMLALVSSAAEIHDQWGKVRESFLNIGRKLLSLDKLLSFDEADAFRREHQRILPFSHTVAVQLRQVARAVDGGRIPLEFCPHGYSTAYQLAAMADVELERAKEAGLVRPDVTRSRLIMWRRAYAIAAETSTSPGRLSTSKLRTELEQLRQERRQNLQRLVEIRRRSSEIMSKLRQVGQE